MNLRQALVLAGALLLAGCGGTDWPAPKPALWQVTSPDGDKGWLLGTVHALPDGVEWQTPLMSDTFRQTNLLVVEIADLDDADQSRAALNQLADQQDLPPLLERFQGPDRARIEALLAQADADPGQFDAMESWVAALALSGAVSRGNPVMGVDRQLLASGKPVVALESFQSQFALFDALPQVEQQDLLLAVACEAAADDPDAALMAWLQGDLAALERLGNACLLGDPELRAALLDGRNAAWIDQIAAAIDGGSEPFVAVGAAHMLGAQGLPALLAARGFAVERIQ